MGTEDMFVDMKMVDCAQQTYTTFIEFLPVRFYVNT